MEIEFRNKEYIDLLEKILQAIPRHFAHWQDAHISKDTLAELGSHYRKRILVDLPDRREFSLMMMALFGSLNNGHTRFYDPMFEQIPPLGFSLRQTGQQWVVKDTFLPELKTGDVILELDHKSVDDWYQELSPYLVGSPQSRSVQFCDWNSIFPPLMQLFLPDCFPIVSTDAHNQHHTLNVDRRTLEQRNQNAAVKACWLVPGKEIMYLKIPSFFTPKFEEDALALIQRYQSAKGMVIDLRGNAGGTTPRRLLSALMDRPYRWWSYSQNDCSSRISSTWTEPEPDTYQGRLSLLVDRATWSAGEDFAMPFQDNERGVLIG